MQFSSTIFAVLAATLVAAAPAPAPVAEAAAAWKLPTMPKPPMTPNVPAPPGGSIGSGANQACNSQQQSVCCNQGFFGLSCILSNVLGGQTCSSNTYCCDVTGNNNQGGCYIQNGFINFPPININL